FAFHQGFSPKRSLFLSYKGWGEGKPYETVSTFRIANHLSRISNESPAGEGSIPAQDFNPR
ncbi:MAG: hypothetical protein ACE15F_17470, partial [bacterium]